MRLLDFSGSHDVATTLLTGHSIHSGGFVAGAIENEDRESFYDMPNKL